MKRIHTITLAAIGTALTLSAQSKFDMPAALLVQGAETQKAVMAKSRAGVELKAVGSNVDPQAKQLVIVTLQGDATSETLLALGYDAETTDSKYVLCRLDTDEMQKLAEFDFVKQISIGYMAEPKLNVARSVNGIDQLHSGTETDGQTFTGKGVITGMMDTGLDPNHSNFTINGEPRITRLWVIDGQYGNVQTFDTPTKIKNYTTDSNSATHATHVLGIMSGSYAGKSNGGEIALVNDRTGKVQISKTRDIPYYGVARESELAVCIGSLHNNNVIEAAKRLHEYGQSQGKPVVMNMSLGSNLGPHDGSDAASKRMAELGKDMLICLSAGNEGAYNISLNKQFTASDKTLKTTMSKSGTASGPIDIWGDNATVFSVSLAAIDKATGNALYTYTLSSSTSGEAKFIGGTGYSNYQNVTVDNAFSKYFGAQGLLTISSNVNPDNNRYNVYISIDLKGGSTNDIVPGIIVEGSAGTGVNMFCGRNGSLEFMSNGLAGFVSGSNENTINGMACGDNVLVVGAYVNRPQVPTIKNGLMSFGSSVKENDIAYFSSFGTTFQGRQLPDVVGPGMGMVSSFNKYYMEANKTSDDYNFRVAEVITNSQTGTRDYWAEMSGTSMSCPFVAGVLALWLEADPTLTMDRVKEIIKKTAVNDEFTAKNKERWGMGKINALGGLKEILGTGAVNTVQADDAADKLIVEALGGKRYSVFVGGTDGFTASLYNMQGALAATVTTDGDSTEIDASQLSEGIYVLQVQGRNLNTSRKFMVK